MAKRSKASVDFGEGKPQAHCGICRHYHATSETCELVEGKMRPDQWCKLFSRRPSRLAEEIAYHR